MIEVLNGIRETIIYDENMSIRFYYNNSFEDYPIHWQPAIEIIMPIENIYTVKIEENTIILNPGDILFISPGVLHQLFAPETGERYILLIEPPLFSNIKGLEALASMFYPYALYTDDSRKNKERMNQLMDNIYTEYSGNSDLKYASLYASILELLVIAGRNKTNLPIDIVNIKNTRSHKYVSKFLDICNYIDEHCTENIGIKELAALSGFSESHFIRLFKQFTNYSYYDYLNRSRITHAKKLLTTMPNSSIVDISLQSGFGSLATFNRLFKSINKCTPTQYRNLQREQ
ncbi:AraC family transcriptional regulator [Candidatus Galacturonibacter soehngenii]|uniref:AraC family transcriptional regulator n=1 Tax=Candidatus Galacturonatibacter soehngenii TaxID=2307010 RepID=A0A7V7QHQ6_9FIRM|nr:AraC family transcriptional regulator [Candidatus Galacturonibacter soehngenii]KAB1434519.1 AraC family transcriptional regulator [Candidatus Galacturonibacter soehngenii]